MFLPQLGEVLRIGADMPKEREQCELEGSATKGDDGCMQQNVESGTFVCPIGCECFNKGIFCDNTTSDELLQLNPSPPVCVCIYWRRRGIRDAIWVKQLSPLWDRPLGVKGPLEDDLSTGRNM